MLPTAVVQFTNGNVYGLLRIMFDCCAQTTAIVDSFVRKHKLKTCRSTTLIDGVGGQIYSAAKCGITLKSRHTSFEIDIEADVVPQAAIKYLVPPNESYLNSSELSNLSLAEKSLKYRSIDLILGNECYRNI